MGENVSARSVGAALTTDLSDAWVRGAFWLLLVLVFGAYAYTYAISGTLNDHAKTPTAHQERGVSKDYIDAKFDDLQKQIAGVRQDIRELKR